MELSQTSAMHWAGILGDLTVSPAISARASRLDRRSRAFLGAIRLLVVLAWVAAAFLYELGVSWDWAELQLLARLGGFVPHKGRKPGKVALCRGLGRLYDSMSTINLLNDYISEHGDLPPRIRALIQGRLPLHL